MTVPISTQFGLFALAAEQRSASPPVLNPFSLATMIVLDAFETHALR